MSQGLMQKVLPNNCYSLVTIFVWDNKFRIFVYNLKILWNGGLRPEVYRRVKEHGTIGIKGLGFSPQSYSNRRNPKSW